jgi:hypothetical protein
MVFISSSPKLNAFLKLLSDSYIYGLFGIFSGLVVNTFSVYVMNFLKISNVDTGVLIRIFLQVFLCVLVIAIYEIFLFKKLALHWRTVTPGFVFFALFFSMQFELFYETTILFKRSIPKNFKL